MKEKDNVQMHINIAGERINLNVAFDTQDDVREAEENVCKLYNKWRRQFPKRSDKELLAMISYQFAYYYLTLGKRYERAAQAAAGLENSLDELLKL